jgi:hypothetical protein
MSSKSQGADLGHPDELISDASIVAVAVLSVLAGNLLTQFVLRRFQPTISAKLVAGWIDEQYFDIDDINHWGLFHYTIDISDEDGREYRIGKTGYDSPIIIQAIHSLEGAQLGTVLSSYEARRQLRPHLEAVLTNVPGTYNYLTAQDESCEMDRMRKIGFEYRLYPDQAGQHELNNALVSMDSAVEYAKRSIEDIAGREGNR